MARILVTGGAGYIGSHTCVELLNAGYDVTIVDNLCNSKRTVVDRIQRITGRQITFVEADVRDRSALLSALAGVDGVIHFAGLKAVGESVAKPLAYYDNNLGSTIALCESMAKRGIRALVFSSSATVYGDPAAVPIKEDFPLSCTNPYGWTKLMGEQILRDTAAIHGDWGVLLLRYFNPIGAHESGEIGEDPNGIPNNLLPYIAKVAVGLLPALTIYGNDYPTRDGTGIRDYIHVVDLARGHVAAMEYAMAHTGTEIFNLGTGRGVSVTELVETFEKVNGVPVPHVYAGRREGDLAVCYANADKARQMLGWQAQLDIADMCRDSWNWQRQNPEGYRGAD